MRRGSASITSSCVKRCCGGEGKGDDVVRMAGSLVRVGCGDGSENDEDYGKCGDDDDNDTPTFSSPLMTGMRNLTSDTLFSYNSLTLFTNSTEGTAVCVCVCVCGMCVCVFSSCVYASCV